MENITAAIVGAITGGIFSGWVAWIAAIIKFTPYTNRRGAKRIDRAWLNYKFPNGIADGEEGKEAFPLDDYARISEPQRIALEKIETLLSVCDHNF